MMRNEVMENSLVKIKVWRARNEKSVIKEYGEMITNLHFNLLSNEIIEIPKELYNSIKEFSLDLKDAIPSKLGKRNYNITNDDALNLAMYIDQHFFTYENPSKVPENYHDTYRGITQIRAMFYPDIMEVIFNNSDDKDPVFDSSKYFMILETECQEVKLV